MHVGLQRGSNDPFERPKLYIYIINDKVQLLHWFGSHQSLLTTSQQKNKNCIHTWIRVHWEIARSTSIRLSFVLWSCSKNFSFREKSCIRGPSSPQCMNHDVGLTHLRARLNIQTRQNQRSPPEHSSRDTFPQSGQNHQRGPPWWKLFRPTRIHHDLSPPDAVLSHSSLRHTHTQRTQSQITSALRRRRQKNLHHRPSFERYAPQCWDEDSDGMNGSVGLSWSLQHSRSASTPSWEHHISAALFVVHIICDLNHTSNWSPQPTQSRTPLQTRNSHMFLFFTCIILHLDKSASRRYIRQCCIIRVVHVNCISDTVEWSSLLLDILCHVHDSSISVCIRGSSHAFFSRRHGCFERFVSRLLLCMLAVLQAGKAVAEPSPRLQVTYSNLRMSTINILPSTLLRTTFRITEHFQPTWWSLVTESGFHSSGLGHRVYVMHVYQMVLLVFGLHRSFLVFPDCSQFIFLLCAVPHLWSLADFADGLVALCRQHGLGEVVLGAPKRHFELQEPSSPKIKGPHAKRKKRPKSSKSGMRWGMFCQKSDKLMRPTSRQYFSITCRMQKKSQEGNHKELAAAILAEGHRGRDKKMQEFRKVRRAPGEKTEKLGQSQGKKRQTRGAISRK